MLKKKLRNILVLYFRPLRQKVSTLSQLKPRPSSSNIVCLSLKVRHPKKFQTVF